MNYIVFDLEWNQSSYAGGENPKIPFEIIEIGAIKLNENREKIGEFSELIRPKVYKTMHSVTKRIIGISMRELANCRSFQKVFTSFKKWCGKDPVFCTWGSQDLTELQRNMAYFGFEPLSQGPLPFLDLQKLFAISFEEEKTRRSLEYATDFLEIEKDIPFHRAFADAYYAAKVFAHIPEEVEKRVSFDLYRKPRNRSEEVCITFDTYEKYISRIFKGKSQAMHDRIVRSTECYKCRKPLPKLTKWYSLNQKNYYCISKCEEHGYMKSKVRVKKCGKDEYEGVFVVKTNKLVSEEEAREYMRE